MLRLTGKKLTFGPKPAKIETNSDTSDREWVEDKDDEEDSEDMIRAHNTMASLYSSQGICSQRQQMKRRYGNLISKQLKDQLLRTLQNGASSIMLSHCKMTSSMKSL
jgi:hypothetical protein